MVAEPRQRDIYELLGVDPSASALLAQEIYWRRVNAFLDADRAGDPAARAAIAELNEALAIIIDAPRRAEYDRQRRAAAGPAEVAPTRDPERRARRRSLLVLAMVPLLGAAMWIAITASGSIAAAIVGVVGLAALLLAARWANADIVAGQSPFRVLHLMEGASVEDVNGAYHAEVNRLLILVRRDRKALRQLEELDSAYLMALESIARGVPAEPLRPSLLTRFVRGAGNGVAALVFGVSRGVVSALTGGTSRIARGAGAATRAGWTAASQRGSGPPPAAAGTIDIERRLATFREVSERVAERPVVEAGAAPAVKANLVLESAAGSRSIPLGTGPLRIGADSGCDLVLRQDGVMPEHALAWLREDVVMLHVVHQGAPCLVNGEPLAWAMLEDGDRVSLGDASFVVSIKE